MTEAEQKPITIHILVYHSTDKAILLERSEDGWGLPGFTLAKNYWIADVAALQQPIQQLLTTSKHWPVLRCVAYRPSTDTEHYCYLLEDAENDWKPPIETLQWVELTQLASLPLLDSAQQALIEAHRPEQEMNQANSQRSAWEKRGWLAEAKGWITKQITLHGYHLIGLEQVKLWDISCILRIHTTSETLYFKASIYPTIDEQLEQPLLFSNEVALTQKLVEIVPQHVTHPLAIDRARGWMIMRDFGEELSKTVTWSGMIQAVQTMAKVQRATITHIADLAGVGCRDRRVQTLPASLEALLKDDFALENLPAEDKAQIHCEIPLLHECIEKLTRYHIPDALMHGDLHLGNMALSSDRQIIIYDWSDGCISHPFLDALLVNIGKFRFPEIADADEQLRRIYLAEWSTYETQENLEEAFARATILTALHQAISYQHILANSTPLYHTIWRQGVTGWLQDMLKLIAQWRQREKERAEA